jgi:hypothetical protein
LSLRPQLGVADSRGGCCRLLGTFVGVVCRLRFRLRCSRNSSIHGSAAIVVLAVSPLAALSLRTAGKSCTASVYAPYSCFPFRSWWRVLLVSAMFWTIRVHLGLWPTDARAMSTPRTRFVTASASVCCCITASEIQSGLTRASEMLGGYISHDTYYHYY